MRRCAKVSSNRICPRVGGRPASRGRSPTAAVPFEFTHADHAASYRDRLLLALTRLAATGDRIAHVRPCVWTPTTRVAPDRRRRADPRRVTPLLLPMISPPIGARPPVTRWTRGRQQHPVPPLTTADPDGIRSAR